MNQDIPLVTDRLRTCEIASHLFVRCVGELLGRLWGVAVKINRIGTHGYEEDRLLNSDDVLITELRLPTGECSIVITMKT